MPGTCAKATLLSCTRSLCVDRPHSTCQAECTSELATCRLARSSFTVELLAQRDRRPVGELRIDGGSAPATATVMGTTRYTGVRAVYSIFRRMAVTTLRTSQDLCRRHHDGCADAARDGDGLAGLGRAWYVRQGHPAQLHSFSLRRPAAQQQP